MRCGLFAFSFALLACASAWEMTGLESNAVPLDGPPRPPPPPPPSPALQKLEQQYQAQLNATCAKVLPHVPVLPTADVNAFMQAYQAFNGTGSEDAVFKAAQVLLSQSSLQAFMNMPDSFTAGGLDADMVLCAVLVDATPVALAGYAVLGQEQEAQVSQLLGNPLLMRDMLVAGGPAGNLYGQAMGILAAINKASTELARTPRASAAAPWDDRNQSTILHRLALGTALGHAVPVPRRYPDPATPNMTHVDPVERYLHYEHAYLAGDLDPATEVLTAFECRWTTNSDASSEDLLWLRTTLGYYRPDEIAMDYSWRYSRAVRTEVAYGDPACANLPGVCNGHYAQIPAAGGECGPRAFFGRFARKAFGLPTWGVTQPGHAAMTCWSPDGWHVLLGADWRFSWWGNRGGDDFYLETQCRELRPEFQKVLRLSWVAKARGDAPVNPSWTPRNPSSYGQGGLWSALTLYAKKVAVNGTSIPTRPIGPSVVPTKVQKLVDAWPQQWPTPNITTDAQGTIIIPAAAYSWKNRSTSLEIFKSFDLSGEQLLNNGGDYVDPWSTSFSYEVNMPEGGPRYLTANITTWHMNTDLQLVTNTSQTPITVPVYYTVGWWNQTQPVQIALVKGKNVLTFMRSSTRELGIKEFRLYINKPDVPPPPSNYTPSPPPKPNDYIEVSAMTTCVKQGITDVPEKYCGLACQSLGLDYTGAKPRMNMTGCYALTSGQWKGNCNYNSNSSATVCDNPPCTVDGSIAQQICLRQ